MDLSASIGASSLGRGNGGFKVNKIGEPVPVKKDTEIHHQHVDHETTEVVILPDKVIEKPTERVVEKIVEVNDVQIVEKVVEDVIEIPVFRYEEEIIEKQVETIVEVEKVVEVPQIHRRIIHRKLDYRYLSINLLCTFSIVPLYLFCTKPNIIT